MPIPDHLSPSLYSILLRCPVFDSPQSLRDVFASAALSPWRDSLREGTTSRAARVTALIADLHEQANDRDENALVLFVRVLVEEGHVAPGTADHRDLSEMLPELEQALGAKTPGRLTTAGGPAQVVAALEIPPPPEPMMDLETELTTFTDVVSGRDPNTHLILVHGRSGMGKTALLNRYRQVTEVARLDFLDFNMATQVGIEGCLQSIAGHLGLQHFPRYMEGVGSPPAPPVSREAEARWHRRLTAQFFQDLSAYAAPRLLLFFDQYEKADPAFKAWITESFLPFISPASPLIIIIAGQEELSPLPSGRNWRHFHLSGVTIDWYYRYAEAWGVALSPDQIEICYEMTRGCPRDFVFLVKARAAGGAP